MADEPVIGSIAVAVVPDATRFWEEFKARTKIDADKGIKVTIHADTGEVTGDLAKVKAQAAATNAEVKVKADTSGARQQMGLLRNAIIGLGPAAVPIGAVATGALLGFLPAGAAAVLAVKGIENQMKSSALQGTQFAADVNVLKSELSQLEKTASANILGGLDQALRSSSQLFPTVNQDIGTYAAQLGQIAAHAGPGLVSLLNNLNPLFTTFGQQLVTGADKFDHWATSSQSVQKFVAYVQAELPNVEQTLGQLVTLAAHVVEGFAPWGGTVLTAVRLLATALNAIPIPVLQTLVPLIVSAGLAWKTWSLADNAAISLGKFSTKLAGSSSAAAGLAPAVASASKVVSGLGVAGAAAAGVLGIMSLVMDGNTNSAQVSAAAMDSYAQSVRQSTDALNQANIAQTQQNLAQQGAFTLLDKLNTQNHGLGLSYDSLVQAVNGSDAQYQKLHDTLTQLEKVKPTAGFSARDVFDQSNRASQLLKIIDTYRNGLAGQIVTQKDLNQANEQSLGINDQVARSAAALYRQTGDDGVAAYLKAKQAVQQLSAQIQQQTLQYQLDNNAAAILKGTLDELNGKRLSAADALNAFQSALVNFTTGGTPGQGPTAAQQGAVTAATQSHAIAVQALAQAQARYDAVLKSGTPTQVAAAHLALERAQLAVTTSTNSLNSATAKLAGTAGTAAGTINGMDSASVQLRGELNQQVSLLEQLVEADGGWQNSTAKSRSELEKLRQQIIDNAVAHGVDRTAVAAYIDSLLKIPTSIPPTKLDIDSSQANVALTKVRDVSGELGNLTKKGYTVDVAAYIDPALQNIAKVQAALGQLISRSAATTTGGQQAEKGYVPYGAANGGVFDFYASGGVNKFADGDHVAQIAPAGAWRMWAEPETGGEAYIPLAEAKRARSEQILGEVASRFGGSYQSRGQVGPNRLFNYSQTITYNNVAPPPEPKPAEMQRLMERVGGF